MIRILIADDHEIVRKGLKQILSETPDIVVSGEASNGHEVLAKVKGNGYDMLLLDISMPGKSGLDVLIELKTLKCKLPVLISSIYPEEQYAMQAFKAGASGYLTKESAPTELINAIRKISQGEKYISASLAERLAIDSGSDDGKPLHEMLSHREHEIMCMIASGRTLAEIAEKLSLSIKTIGTYRTRILEKMSMKSNAEIIRYAIRNQMVNINGTL